MRHAFSFPPEVRNAVRQHVWEAYFSVSRKRFLQESDWIAAVAHGLEGTPYEGRWGRVAITSTVIAARGPGSAEKRSGADLAITATISDERLSVRKAILVQAKLGSVADLPPREKARLNEQIREMRRLTRAPKVLEIPEFDGVRHPRMLSGNQVESGASPRGLPLEDYFTRRILTTFDGDTRPDFVDAVSESDLTRIDLLADLRRARTTGEGQLTIEFPP